MGKVNPFYLFIFAGLGFANFLLDGVLFAGRGLQPRPKRFDLDEVCKFVLKSLIIFHPQIEYNEF